MEKCKIINIKKTNSGRIAGEIELGPDKSMPIPSDFILKRDMDNKKCQIKRIDGRIVKIVVNDKEVEKKSDTKKNYNSQESEQVKNNQHVSIKEANAPYNFVPLNENIVKTNKPEKCNKYSENTGYIDLKIKTKTPIYIRSEKGNNDPGFYKQAGKYRIPGSSLRGVIRTLVEIVSWSKFGFSQVKKMKKDKSEKRYFYRKFTDMSNDLEKQYRKNIIGGNIRNGIYNKTNAGYIKRIKLDEYEIIPAKGNQFYRVEDSDVVNAGLNKPNAIFDYSYRKRGREYKKYKYNKVYEEKMIPVLFKHKPRRTHQHTFIQMKYAKVTNIRKYSENRSEDEKVGYLICSGYIGNRRRGKHLHWVIGPKSNDKITVPDNVINDFNNDWNYKKRISGFDKDNPIEKMNISDSLPCFYITENGENDTKVVKSFGFTGHYRIPYEKSLDKFISSDHNKEYCDLAEAMFGIESEFASRLFFEDQFLSKNDYSKIANHEHIPKILSEPKPTSFQLYLEQDKKEIRPTYKRGRINGWNGLKSYNDKTEIRGNKFYWHRTGKNWKESVISLNEKEFKKYLDEKSVNISRFKDYIVNTSRGKIEISLEETSKEDYEFFVSLIDSEIEKDIEGKNRNIETQHSLIKPINTNAKFKGKIRFENLTDIELGALLFVLDLPEDCCHKIGMGKPIGLGSIEITPKLHLSNREERYSNILKEWKNIKTDNNEKIDELKKKFEKHILKEIDSNADSLWNNKRLKQLKRLLNYKNKPEESSMEYMDFDGDGFSGRWVLPRPTEIQ